MHLTSLKFCDRWGIAAPFRRRTDVETGISHGPKSYFIMAQIWKLSMFPVSQSAGNGLKPKAFLNRCTSISQRNRRDTRWKKFFGNQQSYQAPGKINVLFFSIWNVEIVSTIFCEFGYREIGQIRSPNNWQHGQLIGILHANLFLEFLVFSSDWTASDDKRRHGKSQPVDKSHLLEFLCNCGLTPFGNCKATGKVDVLKLIWW